MRFPLSLAERPARASAAGEGKTVVPSPRRSLAPRVAQCRVEPVDVRLHVGATAFVDDLATHDAPGIRQGVAGRSQCATDAVDAFAEHDLDALDALVQDHELEGLAGFGDADGDFFIVHEGVLSVAEVYFARGPSSENATASQMPTTPARNARRASASLASPSSAEDAVAIHGTRPSAPNPPSAAITTRMSTERQGVGSRNPQ